jgi:hypothetical protein
MSRDPLSESESESNSRPREKGTATRTDQNGIVGKHRPMQDYIQDQRLGCEKEEEDGRITGGRRKPGRAKERESSSLWMADFRWEIFLFSSRLVSSLLFCLETASPEMQADARAYLSLPSPPPHAGSRHPWISRDAVWMNLTPRS